MKPIHTLAMLAIFVLLGGYVLLFEQGPKPADESAFKPKDSILGFTMADVKTVTLSKPNYQLVLEQSQADEWVIKAPKNHAGPADTTPIKDALMPLSSWQAMETLAETLEADKQKDFGLDVPNLTVKLELKSGSKEAYIGSKTPTNTGYYVRVKDNPKLFLSFTTVPDNLEKLLQTPPVPTPTPKPSVEGSATPSEATAPNAVAPSATVSTEPAE